MTEEVKKKIETDVKRFKANLQYYAKNHIIPVILDIAR